MSNHNFYYRKENIIYITKGMASRKREQGGTMNKKISVGIGFGVLLGLVVVRGIYTWGLVNGRKTSSVVVGDKAVVYNQSKISYIDKALDLYYIDERDEEALVEGIYRGYVYGLDDSYTRYLTVDEFNKQKEESEGNYVGTGKKG